MSLLAFKSVDDVGAGKLREMLTLHTNSHAVHGRFTLKDDCERQVWNATGSPSSLQERGRDSCLPAVLGYKRLFTKAYMGCKWFFLKERKNVMFLSNIVSGRFEAFSAS